jgi:hypothetical protein
MIGKRVAMAGQSEMRLRQSMRKRALRPALQDHHMLIQGLNLGRDGRAFRADSFDGTADHRLAPKSDAPTAGGAPDDFELPSLCR